MAKQTPIDAINRVMNALRYSLANYLRFAHPWVDATRQPVAKTIGHVAAVHRQHAARLGELLVERHGHVESRTFPRAFLGLNDLSVEYLLPLAIEDEKQIVRLVEASVAALVRDAEATRLLAEIIDCEKSHLQSLEGALGHNRPIRRVRYIQARNRASDWPAVNGSRQLGPLSVGRRAARLTRGW